VDLLQQREYSSIRIRGTESSPTDWQSNISSRNARGNQVLEELASLSETLGINARDEEEPARADGHHLPYYIWGASSIHNKPHILR
jgi:hypothetical protein